MVGDEDAPNEISLAVNPHNNDNIIIAVNIESYYYSFDGGKTWSSRRIVQSEYGVWGDPCLAADSKENFYYFHLSGYREDWEDKLVCQKSTDGGISWGAEDSFVGYNPPHIQDKEWAVIDNSESPYRDYIYLTWTQCGQGDTDRDNEGSTDPVKWKKATDIYFARSTDEGSTWSKPFTINSERGSECEDAGNTVLGSISCIGDNGELYTCWASGKAIIFNRSTNGGISWLSKDIIAADLPNGFKLKIPGIYRCFGFPSIAYYKGPADQNGTIYICSSDQRVSENDADVWLIKSTDEGSTWSEPLRVNDDPPGKQQFFPNMTIDQSNGFVYVVYYDRRNYDDNRTDVYLAKSTDSGNSFSSERISQSPFSPESETFIGDYISISASNGKIRPVWTRLDTTKLSIWTAIINEGE